MTSARLEFLAGLVLACSALGPAAAIASESIRLFPEFADNEVGTQHTVFAIVTDAASQPVVGRQVDFSIQSGPHGGLTGSSLTDQRGYAFFTYTGTTAGDDVIVAIFVDSDGFQQASNVARKFWLLPRCGNGIVDPGEDCEPETLCAGDCNPVLGYCFDYGCNNDCTCPCGNGILERGQECDDGNRIRGDGCSPGCLIEWCPLGVSFWKTHPRAWEVDSLDLGQEIYSEEELLAILKTPSGAGGDADANLILAAQMIAAKLNVARGSAVTVEIFFIFAFRDPFYDFSGKLPYHVDPDSPVGEQMLSAARVLEAYNKGEFTPACVRRTREERQHVPVE